MLQDYRRKNKERRFIREAEDFAVFSLGYYKIVLGSRAENGCHLSD